MSGKQSGSCIKVHGVTLLPPIITEELRKYIKSVREKAVQIEKRLADKKREKLRVNRWTEVSCELGLFECGQEMTLMEWKGAALTVSSSNTSTQTELDKKQSLEIISLNYPIRKEKTAMKWRKTLYSSPAKEKWTSCPSRLGTSSTIQNETVSIGPEELNVTESYSDEWKRWMSLPDVYDMTSSVTSESSQEFTHVTDRMAKLEISPDRQKSYTLVRPSKYLIDYVKKKAYEYCTTPNLPIRHKSYTVIEPSKFLLDYVKNKGYVGPVEDYVPEQSSPGSSKLSSAESQRFMYRSFPTAPIKCQKCRNKNCLCGEELPASYPTQELKNTAATKINAAVRGYLVRRLMKTRHVQQCLDTMRYTLQCHIAISSKSDDCEERDVELRLRFMRQLLNSCEEFYNIFFGSTRKEQLKIIANDRLLLSE